MEENTRIRIGGIKFSEELMHLSVVSHSSEKTSIENLLRLLAGRHINIPFFCHSLKKKHSESCLCFLPDDLLRVQEVLFLASYTNDNAHTLPSVGTLTLFPHRNSLQLLGLVLRTFAHHNYPIHSLSTSISAIALNTDFHLLDDIAGTLSNVVSLPENHAPFRQEFRLTQLY